MTLTDVFVLLVVATAAYALWRHAEVSSAARAAVQRYVDQHQMILLDQSVYLHRLIPRFSGDGLKIERHYRFEFSTTANSRYRGHVIFIGKALKQIELEPHRFQ